MKKILLSVLLCALSGLFNSSSFVVETKILTNHLGYEPIGPKHAVIFGKRGDPNFARYQSHLLGEAMFGTDYMVQWAM